MLPLTTKSGGMWIIRYARPSRCGEKRTAVWPSHHEERGSEGAVAPPLCDYRVILHHCVVRPGCRPSGSAVATCLNATVCTRRAARAVQGDVVSVGQLLERTPSAPPIPAQRVARFDDHCTRNSLLKNKLRQRYSRYITVANNELMAAVESSTLGRGYPINHVRQSL